MMDPTPSGSEATPPVRESLRELAHGLRAADHLGPDARRELADLVEELAAALDPSAAAPVASHLADSSAHLVEVLHQPHREPGLLAAARARLAEAAARAEARLPVASGVAHRIIEVLSDVGI